MRHSYIKRRKMLTRTDRKIILGILYATQLKRLTQHTRHISQQQQEADII